MEKDFNLKRSVEKIIVSNRLYDSLIRNCSDGLILCSEKDLKILMMNENGRKLLDLPFSETPRTLAELFDPKVSDKIRKGETLNTERNGIPVKVRSSVTDGYIWIFVADFTDVIRVENFSQKTLELNKELIGVFNEYGEETLVVVNEKGMIEYAGEKISRTCGVAFDYFVGKNVYEIEKEGVFSPSVSARVLETGQPQVVIQKTRIGEELVSVGTPVFNGEGKIEKVVSVTRDYSTQMKISKMIAELRNQEPDEFSASDIKTDQIVTCNNAMFEIKTLVKMIAATRATVLINGETGTGKEMIARYIYSLSDRKEQPFIKVNCGTISHSIVESELFGYEEGSFTGASRGGKIGLIEAANGGTLFLDEVSELPLEQQVKLLHVLQEKMLIRVGGTTQINLNIRVIAATNKNLEEQVALGNFREDLYYRLNVIPISIPPLRERKEDIPLLANYFFKRFCSNYKKEMQLSNSAISMLEKYSWPGNIRQLENTIERLVLTTPKPVITAGDLPKVFWEGSRLPAVKVNKIIRLDAAIEELEKELIRMAVEEYGTTVKAAEALGVNQSTVSRKMAQYHLKEDRRNQRQALHD